MMVLNMLPVSETSPLLVNTETAARLPCVSERTLWILNNCRDVPYGIINRVVRLSRDLLYGSKPQKKQPAISRHASSPVA